jgi:hypothetical protein
MFVAVQLDLPPHPNHTNTIPQVDDVATFQNNVKYKACPNESGTEVGAQLFPAVELCDCEPKDISKQTDI